jgi:hypothetical protein
MLNATPHTFIDIFEANPAENDDIFIKGIDIPIIQRDYAQGRENDEVSRIRSRFLDALRHALIDDSPITLDFVYGEINDDGYLIPLDGQQRLTTLFLLHWYVSKHEGISPEKSSFLDRFSYDTRYSAREFCKKLAQFTPEFENNRLSEDILDQSWFPMDWTNDPTIASMLVMIDAIHDKFKDTAGIWEKLEAGCISFYFLPLKEMGLTDELYIKMNSRGKPLTQFEHFKAELEGAMKLVDKEASERISKKIDLAWTDMLWPYKGDNEIIDDEFIRYFHFICDLINYQNESPLIEDPFEMVQTLFGTDNPNAGDNMHYVEQMFDCWCGFNIDSFFEEYLTTGEHTPEKSIVGKMTNLFLDCCNVYGEMQGARIRRFPIGRTILLYAFILYLRNQENLAKDDFVRRLRIVNNLVRASEFELRDDRMKTLLSQTEAIIVEGKVEETDKSFNINQLKEEICKKEWIESHPDEEVMMREAEDHRLLNGAIRVLGVDNIPLYPKFKQLYECDWDLVDRALLATGDYSRFIRWRYQIGSSKIEAVWRDMFNTAEEEMANTKQILHQLLLSSETITNDILKKVIDDYMSSSPMLDWRYYIVKYPSMRPGRYGMYRWPGDGLNGKKSREILMMTTEKSTNGWNYNIFLKTLYDSLHEEFPDLYLGNYAFQHDGDKLLIGTERAISCDDASFTVYEVLNDKTYNPLSVESIPQSDTEGADAEDRIVIGTNLIRTLHS